MIVSLQAIMRVPTQQIESLVLLSLEVTSRRILAQLPSTHITLNKV